jgi:hypothetical protein
MKYFYSKILFFVFLFFSFHSSAQVEFKQVASNRIIQKHRTENQLKKIQESDPLRLQTLYAYFTKSFTFTVSTGEEISLEKLMNIYHFDINEYEMLRLENVPHSFIYKDKFVITLLSSVELSQLLNGYNLTELLNSIPARPFPTFVSTGNIDQDFQNYKEKVWDWARDFPTKYQEFTSSESVKHIRFSDYLQMSEEKRALVTQEPHLFID